MIEVKRLVKSLDGFRALDGLDLHAEKGSVYGLIGPNGAGKSTLIRHLCGIYRQDCGTVRIDGQDIYENPAVKGRIACIPDEIFYFVSASTRDLKKFYSGIYKSFDEERYKKLGDVFEADERKPIRTFSRGMQKQAAFRLALSMRPEVMILDEPVDGLDPVMRRQIWSLILQDVSERGMTVLISSHNLRELEDVCDCVGVISRGRMLLERSLSSLQDNIVKLQIVTADDTLDTTGLNVLHRSTTGRINTLIVRGNTEQTRTRAAAMNPVFFDILPISLEEIFIYELGGENYAVKDLVI